MVSASNFTAELEAKVEQQLKSQRAGYLLGAGFQRVRRHAT